MKKSLALLAVLTALLVVPAIAVAKTLCATGSPNGFFRLDVGGCKATSKNVYEVTGRWEPGFACAGRNSWGIHGTCYGTGTEIRMNLTSELPATTCRQVMWFLAGPAPNANSGGFDNAPFGSNDGGFTMSPASCSSEPALGVVDLDVEGPVAGRN